MPFPRLPPFSVPHRFRLGTPSYVYPADLLPNARALARRVEDIELVLFESGAPLPTPATIERLGQLAADHGLTYTVHLPIDRRLGGPDRAERMALQRRILDILALTAPLSPLAYILHLAGVDPAADAAGIRAWQKAVAARLPAIVAGTERPSRVCLENLDYPFEWCEVFLDRFGLGVCLDTGHLALAGGDWDGHVRRYADRLRVIHLHGLRDGKDHRPLTDMPGAWLDRFLNSIDNFTGVLTLELFDFDSVRGSLECLSQGLARRSRDQV